MVLDTLQNLLNQTGFATLDWGNYVMILVALVFMYLAIAKGFEPLLLVPISFGMLLVNLFPDIMQSVEDAKAAGNAAGGLSIISTCLMNGVFCRHSYSWVSER